MITLYAKTIVGALILVCMLAIVMTGIAISAALQLIGCPDQIANIVYGLWATIMTIRLALESRNWARLVVKVRGRLSDSYRASPRAKS